MFPFGFDHDPIFSEVLEPGPNTIVGIYGVYVCVQKMDI